MILHGNSWKPVGQGFILTNQLMYQVDQRNAYNWKTIQYVHGTPNFGNYHCNSYEFKKGKYLYAIDCLYHIWQIDTEFFGAKLIVSL